MSIHHLKIQRQPYEDLVSGRKAGEVRNCADREFREGDQVELFLIDETGNPANKSIVRTITHIQRGFGLPDDICVLSYANHSEEPLGMVAAPVVERQEPVALTVWCGPMPESNGRSNFTAILMRKDATFLDGITGGITIERSEYPDRVRYEADRMRYLIGELGEEPDILAYDEKLHSGYIRPEQPAPVAAVCLTTGRISCLPKWNADSTCASTSMTTTWSTTIPK